jgi:hypothetical protein
VGEEALGHLPARGDLVADGRRLAGLGALPLGGRLARLLLLLLLLLGRRRRGGDA